MELHITGTIQEINRLDDTVQGFTTFSSKARKISPNGNLIIGEIVLSDTQNNFVLAAAIWEGPQRTLRILEDHNGNFIQGIATDVSDSGYVVGSIFDASFNSFGFIWNDNFENGVEIFEDWLDAVAPGTNFPFVNIQS